MAEKKKRAFVMVSQNYINTGGVSHILNHGRDSQADTHMIIAPIFDESDHRGLWLDKIVTDQLRNDGTPVTVRFMIPWSEVIGLGLLDESTPSGAIGFQANAAVTVFGEAD